MWWSATRICGAAAGRRGGLLPPPRFPRAGRRRALAGHSLWCRRLGCPRRGSSRLGEDSRPPARGGASLDLRPSRFLQGERRLPGLPRQRRGGAPRAAGAVGRVPDGSLCGEGVLVPCVYAASSGASRLSGTFFCTGVSFRGRDPGLLG